MRFSVLTPPQLILAAARQLERPTKRRAAGECAK
jgi:hypothetical protein